jgi:hypothetical protein
MAHIIDNSDHWEHKDKSICRANFLKYGRVTWKAINFHPLFYQNRLRHSDYLAAFHDAGFAVTSAEREVCERTKRALETFNLQPEFRRYDKDDLATITSRNVATPVRAS